MYLSVKHWPQKDWPQKDANLADWPQFPLKRIRDLSLSCERKLRQRLLLFLLELFQVPLL